VNLRGTQALCAMAAGLWLASCATVPELPMTVEEQYEPERVEVLSPLVEYPPIEPVEPPVALEAPPREPPAAAGQRAPDTVTGAPPSIVATAPPSIVAVPPAALREPAQPPEDVELVALLNDLQRYNAFSPDDAKRELASVTVLLTRQRTDANRIRLAILYTIVRASPQDDQRALQLLDNVAKSNPGSLAVKQLAVVLHAQIVGRTRAVREEQQKADAALQKLEALRQMERSLMRDRTRSGGGGGSGSGGGSGGGGGGGGGGG
jgi:hypothetical protein